jgi:hypothetical protein
MKVRIIFELICTPASSPYHDVLFFLFRIGTSHNSDESVWLGICNPIWEWSAPCVGVGETERQALGHRNKSGDGQSSSRQQQRPPPATTQQQSNKHSEGCNCGCFDDVVSLTCGICLRMLWGRLVELIVRWWKDAIVLSPSHHTSSSTLRCVALIWSTLTLLSSCLCFSPP